ncbi:hypothetical protein HII36_05745 [Nonomuraea sp. NN258]|uniref:hypothetical protein n=1 Tax=Nonomuraea antri TaxID=2730852 RepID=UPI00156A4B6F|nr:hypothetical protein [Nonomuraea antri]NRQ31342.1 hypothetical protein [Nonomuraea antri]
MAALAAAFIVGTAAFTAAVVHIVRIDEASASGVAIMAGACVVVGATVMLAVRRRPHIAAHADMYESALAQVSADR